MLISNIVDEEILKQIYDNSVPFPDIKDNLYLSKKVIYDNGEIVAIGLVRLTCEGIVFVNPNSPKTARVRAIKELINIQSDDAKRFGLKDCHVFIKRSGMLKFLEKLGFIKLKDEQSMMINL